MDLPSNKKELFDALTYKIPRTGTSSNFNEFEIVRNYRMITPTVVSIPQGRTDLIPADYEIVDKRVLEFADFPAPIHPLFPEQQVVYDQVDESCFINALVGWGKTFTALHLANKLGQKTLVVTHTSSLRDQWIEEVEKLYGFTPGIIGGGKYTSHDCITVGNIQSLTKDVARLSKQFGTVIMDEAHHVPATTFTTLINELHARYRIALSGTMTRKDGKHVLFRDYFGSKIYKPPQNNTINPKVQLLKTNIKLPPASTWADKVTKLLLDPEYQALVASLAAVQASKGHKVLVIADRVEFLQNVTELLQGKAVCIIGETEDRKGEIDRVLSGECDIICGSRPIFSEGISVNPLSCVILATPIANPANLEQICGRIMRLHEDKLDPVVIDIQFKGPTETRQNHGRIAFYLEKGWKVEQL